MQTPHHAPGDMLQVIPRRADTAVGVGPTARADDRSEWTGSRDVPPVPAERRRQLTRVVVATLGVCGVILVAAGVAHVARSSNADTGSAAKTSVVAPPGIVAPVAPAPAPAPVPVQATSGTVRMKSTANIGHVWLDGQKLTTASAVVTCGTHQVKFGSRGKAHAIEVPCGGEALLGR